MELHQQVRDQSQGQQGLPSKIVNDLKKHGLHSVDRVDAENLLKNQMAYTYLVRPGEDNYKYWFSFVDENGIVHHDTFTLVNAKYGLWVNYLYHHVGTLNKVIRDMMNECGFSKGQPLV